MRDGGDRKRGRKTRTHSHGQDLQQRAEHYLEHDAGGEEVNGGQGAGRPARNEEIRIREQQEALVNLDGGARDLAQQIIGNPNGQLRQSNAGTAGVDPLGRPLPTTGPDTGDETAVPQEIDRQREKRRTPIRGIRGIFYLLLDSRLPPIAKLRKGLL